MKKIKKGHQNLVNQIAKCYGKLLDREINPMNEALNVFNEPLIVCGTSPVTGAYRDGCCNTGANDRGTHTVCAVVTDAFYNFQKAKAMT